MEGKRAINFGDNDLRVRKTQMALYATLRTLLEHRNFNSITVHELCTQALVSRATFYTHFRDKYDLLAFLLSLLGQRIAKDTYKYDALDRSINQFIDSNKQLISNIIKDANDETVALLQQFMSQMLASKVEEMVPDDKSPQHIVLFTFFSGGLLNLLTWIVNNSYPPEINMMNPYLHEMIEVVAIWDAEHGASFPVQ